MYEELQALDSALASARAAILEAHPELLEPKAGDHQAIRPGPVRLGAASWVGDEILAHIAGLTAALSRYSIALEMERVLLDPLPAGARAEAPPGCRGREQAA
ncbi:MAG TPA: hypothetical protein VIG99_21455 [Myxococcaceae bacterium]|jgi:hypothetical protein